MKTKDVQKNRPHGLLLDRADRILLRLLAEKADRPYAELGELVHLSPPAVHERVKRLRRTGFIKGTIAKLDGEKIGRPLLAFVHVRTEGWGMNEPVLELQTLSEVEEIHTATGDVSLILKVRCSGPTSLEKFLLRLQHIEGVCSTHSYVILNTYLERGPMPSDIEATEHGA